MELAGMEGGRAITLFNPDVADEKNKALEMFWMERVICCTRPSYVLKGSELRDCLWTTETF